MQGTIVKCLAEMITERFAEQIHDHCKRMSIKDAAETAMVDPRTAKRIDKKMLQEKFKSLKRISPTKIGIDEIAHEKGHKYLTVVRDLDKGVIWVGEKRKKETLDKFFAELGEKKSKKITSVVIEGNIEEKGTALIDALQTEKKTSKTKNKSIKNENLRYIIIDYLD